MQSKIWKSRDTSDLKKERNKPKIPKLYYNYMPNNFFYQEGIIKHFKVNYSTINMSIQQVQLNQRY